MQYLYARDLQGELGLPDDHPEAFWSLRLAKAPAREFAGQLLEGILVHLDELDAAIRPTLQNYTFQRLAAVDRNILRLGAYEILFGDHIPPRAAINEAIEIAKRLGNEESPSFVNGILDRVLRNRTEA